MPRRNVLQFCTTALIVLCCRGEAVSQTDFWQKVTGPNGDTVNALAINASGTIFAATTKGGLPYIARSTDDGLTWTLSNPGVSLERFAFSPNGTVFAVGFLDIYCSTDDGSTWTKNTGPPHLVNTLAVNNSGLLFSGWASQTREGYPSGEGGGVERSTDNGASWVDAGLRANSDALAINASGIIFSGGVDSAGACVFRSTDNGSKWTNTGFFTFFNNSFVTAFAISHAGHIFVGTSTNGVCHSTDNGAHWLTSAYGPGSNVISLAVNAIGDVFAGTDAGVWRSTDDGNIWTLVNSGLPATNDPYPWVTLAINPRGTVFAATRGGLFRTVQSTTSVTEPSSGAPTKFALEQNYPNPFNPSTTISFTLPTAGLTTLKVFDLLGNEVRTLLDGELSAGAHEARFNGAGFASGVYFYQLSSGSLSQTRKLVLTR